MSCWKNWESYIEKESYIDSIAIEDFKQCFVENNMDLIRCLNDTVGP